MSHISTNNCIENFLWLWALGKFLLLLYSILPSHRLWPSKRTSSSKKLVINFLSQWEADLTKFRISGKVLKMNEYEYRTQVQFTLNHSLTEFPVAFVSVRISTLTNLDSPAWFFKTLLWKSSIIWLIHTSTCEHSFPSCYTSAPCLQWPSVPVKSEQHLSDNHPSTCPDSQFQGVKFGGWACD